MGRIFFLTAFFTLTHPHHTICHFVCVLCIEALLGSCFLHAPLSIPMLLIFAEKRSFFLLLSIGNDYKCSETRESETNPVNVNGRKCNEMLYS